MRVCGAGNSSQLHLNGIAISPSSLSPLVLCRKDNLALLVVAAAAGDFIILVWFGLVLKKTWVKLCYAILLSLRSLTYLNLWVSRQKGAQLTFCTSYYLGGSSLSYFLLSFLTELHTILSLQSLLIFLLQASIKIHPSEL